MQVIREWGSVAAVRFSPAIQESGHGGTFVLPTTNIDAPGGEFNSIPVGAPFFGHDVHNQNLCKWSFPTVSQL